MADTKVTTAPENPRKAIREARERRLRVIDGPSKTVKVYPANETVRAIMRHANGKRFRETLDQAVDWPNDAFTTRRIAEGSVLTEAGGGGEVAEPDVTKNPREQAAANKPKPKKEAKAEPESKDKDSASKPRSQQPTSPSPAPAT